jgi:hypothetical protein
MAKGLAAIMSGCRADFRRHVAGPACLCVRFFNCQRPSTRAGFAGAGFLFARHVMRVGGGSPLRAVMVGTASGSFLLRAYPSRMMSTGGQAASGTPNRAYWDRL